jgi:hypothetical protein
MKRSRSDAELTQLFLDFDKLPDEVIEHLMLSSNLTMGDLRRASLAIPTFRVIYRDIRFWDALFLRRIVGGNPNDPRFAEWKAERSEGMDEFVHYATWVGWTRDNAIELKRENESIVFAFIHNRLFGEIGLYITASPYTRELLKHEEFVERNNFRKPTLFLPNATRALGRLLVYAAIMDGCIIRTDESKRRILAAPCCIQCKINPSTLQFEGRQETFCTEKCARVWWT